MNLIDKDIVPFLHGAIETERLETGMLPLRMTAAQLARADREERFVARARSAAGMQIAFITDSPSVHLRMHIPAVNSIRHSRVTVDIECDGWVRQQSVAVSDGEQALFDAPVVNGGDERMRTVRLYLPYHRPVHIQAVEVARGARVEPLPRGPKRLLAIGDSITQGAYAGCAYTAYAVQLARLLDAELLNHGLGGHVFDEEILDEKLVYQPDLVTVAYGTNDW
ncbi:MAG: hypothetical protein GF331_14835, partial [Chitinivibrionales bacterium]|nr:hypothetical protein [Chitinivibrionales bacterium]